MLRTKHAFVPLLLIVTGLVVSGCCGRVDESGTFGGLGTTQTYKFTNTSGHTVTTVSFTIRDGQGVKYSVNNVCDRRMIVDGGSCTVTVTQAVAGTPPADALVINVPDCSGNISLP
jgi:hypothetical protein